jgi:catechol-2,3-dioxygenase
VTLSVSNLASSLQYWNQLLGMKIYSQSETNAMLGYGDDQVCVLPREYTYSSLIISPGSSGVGTSSWSH